MSDVTAVFAYSHLNTAIDQRERAYYPNYFINHSEERCEATLLPCSQEKNSRLIGHFGKYHNTLGLSPKFCISIVFVFSWDRCKSQEKLETMRMQNLGEQTKSIMVFSKVAYGKPKVLYSGHIRSHSRTYSWIALT